MARYISKMTRRKAVRLSEYIPVCGIYRITNMRNNRIYIGKSSDIYNRWSEHIRLLVSGNHHNKKLLSDFIEFGANCFIAEVLFECSPEELKEMEDKQIMAHDRDGCDLYNLIKDKNYTRRKYE